MKKIILLVLLNWFLTSCDNPGGIDITDPADQQFAMDVYKSIEGFKSLSTSYLPFGDFTFGAVSAVEEHPFYSHVKLDYVNDKKLGLLLQLDIYIAQCNIDNETKIGDIYEKLLSSFKRASSRNDPFGSFDIKSVPNTEGNNFFITKNSSPFGYSTIDADKISIFFFTYLNEEIFRKDGMINGQNPGTEITNFMLTLGEISEKEYSFLKYGGMEKIMFTYDDGTSKEQAYLTLYPMLKNKCGSPIQYGVVTKDKILNKIKTNSKYIIFDGKSETIEVYLQNKTNKNNIRIGEIFFNENEELRKVIVWDWVTSARM